MTRTGHDGTILGQLTDALEPPHVAIKICRLRRPSAGFSKRSIYSQLEFDTPYYSHQDVSIASMVSKALCIPDFCKAARTLYLPLQIFCSVCYNPTGIIGEKTDGLLRMKKNEPPS